MATKLSVLATGAAALVLALAPASATADYVSVYFDSSGNVGAGPNPFTPGGPSNADNSLLGPAMLPFAQSATKNVAAGTEALHNATTASRSVALGYPALRA